MVARDNLFNKLENITMPKVGSKHFAYTKKGRASAKAYAKKTGQRVKHRKKKNKKSFAEFFHEMYG